MPQIEKPDDLQLNASHPVFCVCMTIASMMKMGNLSVNLHEILTRSVEQHCI